MGPYIRNYFVSTHFHDTILILVNRSANRNRHKFGSRLDHFHWKKKLSSSAKNHLGYSVWRQMYSSIKCLCKNVYSISMISARVGGCQLATAWACKNGECIDASKHCDGTANCKDGSDETREDCSTFLCDVNKFRCSYGACVGLSSQCDGRKDCSDSSDEANCQAGKFHSNFCLWIS